MQSLQRLGLTLLLIVLFATSTRAADPPHDATNGIDCESCHSTPPNLLGDITSSEGNASLCLGCHALGLVPTDAALHREGQAKPGTSGSSHRWDSSCLSYVRIVSPTKDTGTIGVEGAWTLATGATFTCNVTTGGNVGTAAFDWTDSLGGSGSASLASRVALHDGLELTFTDKASGTSFPVGMQFNVYTEPMGTPSSPAIANALMDGKATCSTCHDQHSNANPPFLRVTSEGSALCESCHGDRSMGKWTTDPLNNIGHHPTGVAMPLSPFYAASIAPLQLDPALSTVECESCHSAHHADSGGDGDPTVVGAGDGKLLRAAGDATLCQTCHQMDGHNGADCLDCHTTHGTTNIKLVRNVVNGKPVTLASMGAGAMVEGSPSFDGVCENCHKSTAYHRGDASGDHTHFANKACTSCHVHRNSYSPRSNDCLSCHESEQNTTADGLARREVGAEFRSSTGHHPFTYNYRGDLSNPQDNNCLICHLEHSYDDPLHGNQTVDLDPDPDGSGASEWQTYPGTLHDWCVDCHDGDNPNVSRRLSGTVASNKSGMAVTSSHRQDYPNGGAIFAGLCSSCHVNGHTVRVKFFSQFGGDGTEELACYGCHGLAANVSYQNRYMDNLKVSYMGTGAVPPRSNHAGAGETIGDGRVLCRQCHDPHQLDHASNMVCDPDNRQTSWNGAVDNAWCLKCHDGSQAAAPLHLDINITGQNCQTCHLPHASTNRNLLLIAELSTRTAQLAPSPATVAINDFLQFEPSLVPSLPYLTPTSLKRQADWAIEGLSGGSGGNVQQFTANIPLDRSVGYDPSGWGLISVKQSVQVTTGPTNVEDLNVEVGVQHHYRGDLEIWLRNITTGAVAKLAQSNWSDGGRNLYKVYNSESPNPPGDDVYNGPVKVGTGIFDPYVATPGFTGPNGTVYTVTITVQGNAGVARFDWSDSTGGSGTNQVAGTTPVAMSYGAVAIFYNAYGGTTPQFKVGDSWTYKPTQHWDTQPDSLIAFNDRNSNGTWEMEIHDTWPSDNSTNPASADYCYWRSWSLLINSGVLGNIDEMGLFKALYAGTGRVYARYHHGKLWPVQSGLSDYVFENPTPISASVDLTTGAGGKRAAQDLQGSEGAKSRQDVEVQLERAVRRAEVLRSKASNVGIDPHSPEVIADRACVNCHGKP